jgi:hypothetical protein
MNTQTLKQQALNHLSNMVEGKVYTNGTDYIGIFERRQTQNGKGQMSLRMRGDMSKPLHRNGDLDYHFGSDEKFILSLHEADKETSEQEIEAINISLKGMAEFMK